jgi:hypothetical protein
MEVQFSSGGCLVLVRKDDYERDQVMWSGSSRAGVAITAYIYKVTAFGLPPLRSVPVKGFDTYMPQMEDNRRFLMQGHAKGCSLDLSGFS